MKMKRGYKMIKKLIQHFDIQLKLRDIKKHFKAAKKITNASERKVAIENVQNDLLDFEGKLITNQQLNDLLENRINWLIFKMENAKTATDSKFTRVI